MLGGFKRTEATVSGVGDTLAGMPEQTPNPTTEYPVGTVLACPECGSTERLGELETVEAISVAEQITVGEEGLVYEWSGHTDFFQENSETIGVVCRKCDWEGQEAELVAARDQQRANGGHSPIYETHISLIEAS